LGPVWNPRSIPCKETSHEASHRCHDSWILVAGVVSDRSDHDWQLRLCQVPPLIQFSNVAADEGGNPLSGVVSITFSLYTTQQGGEPLWMETQNNVQLDSMGHYSVMLGITKPNGVPTTLFTTGAARWLGVKITELPEQPRVFLLSVPYALKAGNATTIGGLPPSAFVLAAPKNGAPSTAADSVTVQTTPPPRVLLPAR
jgi:hypothetical protein